MVVVAGTVKMNFIGVRAVVPLTTTETIATLAPGQAHR
jgi:hypothetical protein